MVGGVLVAAIIGYSIFIYLWPLRGAHSGLGLAFAALIGLCVLKIAALHWFTGYYFDLLQFSRWALRIAAVGPRNFYAGMSSRDALYAPVAIYALWPAGTLSRTFGLSWNNLRILVESPPLLGDLVTSITMFAYLRRSGRTLVAAWVGMLLVALNPGLLFDTVVWGQTDSVVTALMWLATLVVLDSQYILGAAVLAFAVLAKPHALILIPLLACWVWRRSGISRLAAPTMAFIAATIVAAGPFALGRAWGWLPRFYIASLGYYHETSANAFNLMGLVGGLRQAETTALFGASDFTLGMVLVMAVLMVSCIQVWRNPRPTSLLLAIFLALFGEFLFGPRMHERYLFPAIVFFAPVALEGMFWLGVFGLLTLSWLFNLAYVFHTLNTVLWLVPHDAPAMLDAALNLLLFGAVLSRITTLKQAAASASDQTVLAAAGH